MSITQLIFAFSVMMLVAVWYSTASMRNKILCTCRTPSKTKLELLIPMNQRYVFFKMGGWVQKFNVLKDCITYQEYTRGIHKFFPTNVATLDFVWTDTNPIDPDTGNVYIMSPAVRNSMYQEERFKDYTRAQEKVAGTPKLGFFQKYGVFIAIGIALLGFAFLYMQTKGLNSSITLLAEYYKDLAGKVH